MHVPELLLLVLCALCSSSIVVTTLDCGMWTQRSLVQVREGVDIEAQSTAQSLPESEPSSL